MVGEKRLDFMSFMSVECNQPAKSSVVRVGTKVNVNSLQRKGICLFRILKIVSFVFFYSPEMFGLCQLIALKVCISGKM